MDMNEARIKKIYELAMRGVGGEKESAQTLLNKLLDKYKINIEEIIDNEAKDIYFYDYHGKYQKTLLIQTFYKITNSAEHYTMQSPTGRTIRTKLGVECTASQKVEIDLLFDFYCTLWEKEQKALLSAFIQKHKIFGDSQKGADNSHKYTQEELDKMLSMMNGLSNETPLLRIEERRNNI